MTVPVQPTTTLTTLTTPTTTQIPNHPLSTATPPQKASGYRKVVLWFKNCSLLYLLYILLTSSAALAASASSLSLLAAASSSALLQACRSICGKRVHMWQACPYVASVSICSSRCVPDDCFTPSPFAQWSASRIPQPFTTHDHTTTTATPHSHPPQSPTAATHHTDSPRIRTCLLLPRALLLLRAVRSRPSFADRLCRHFLTTGVGNK